jgi:predicted enzyme related to lactoylglutathione lyase
MTGIAYFEIQADNPESTILFYAEIFGWTFAKAEGLPIPYWRIETGAYVCSMEIDNFDSAAAEIIKRGGQVALEKFAVPGVCWQGYFIDPDGNTFGLFQPDPHAK